MTTVKLDNPITVDGISVSELSMREPCILKKASGVLSLSIRWRRE